MGAACSTGIWKYFVQPPEEKKPLPLRLTGAHKDEIAKIVNDNPKASAAEVAAQVRSVFPELPAEPSEDPDQTSEASAAVSPEEISKDVGSTSAPSAAALPQAPPTDYELFLEQVSKAMAWNQRLRIWEDQGGWRVAENGGRVGLTNLKNTCWMNSGLQCLLHLRPLVEVLLEGRQEQRDAAEGSAEESSGTNGVNGGGPRPAAIAQALHEMLKVVWQQDHGEHRAVAPYKLKSELMKYVPYLVSGRQQQDAQEFLAVMLDAVHEEMKIKLPEPTMNLEEKFNEIKKPGSGEEYQAAWAWAHYLQSAQSPIVDIFQGQLRSLLTCSQCGYSSRSFDPFWHLSLPVKPGDSSLTDALEAFASEEQLTGTDRWDCEMCGKKVDATKRMEIYKLPPVIILHLKRNSYNKEVGLTKINARIELPERTVDEPVNLEMYTVSRQKGEAMYDIIGIVNHHGEAANSGHYTAHCLHCVECKWYCFDDRTVTKLAINEEWLPEQAYILFLMKRRNQQLLADVPVPSDLEERKRLKIAKMFSEHVPIQPQSVDAPEDWPHMCNLVGIRRQLQLFNYMPADIDLTKLGEYRAAYQRFRTGKGMGAKGEILHAAEELTKSDPAVMSCGTPLPPPLGEVQKQLSIQNLASIRTEYQRWRMNARLSQRLSQNL
mmetsp:Transcript_112625/g.223959  ORF Transcript_112625/g.223959 Transcript_112625/m.223959 type:complete len:659 (-) Transcript_112625:211-2187(-)